MNKHNGRSNTRKMAMTSFILINQFHQSRYYYAWPTEKLILMFANVINEINIYYIQVIMFYRNKNYL